MAIFNTHVGSWKTPELGVTEWLQKTFAPSKAYASTGGSNLIGTNSAQESQPTQSGGTVLGDQTYGPTYSGPASNYNADGSSGVSGGTSGGEGIIAPSGDSGGGSGPSELDIINQEFDSFNSFLGDQERTANERFSTLQGNITTERDTAVSDAQAQRGLRDKELDQTAESGRQNERLNLQKVRQLLQDLDQRNAARIAVTGGGGSVSEALADRFGRYASQNVGGVLQEGQNFQNKVALEKEKVAQFYDNAVQKIKDTAKAQVDNARVALSENLRAIDADRRASAGEKAKAIYNSWRNYYDNVNRAKLQAANFQAQYDLWAKTKSAELAGANNYAIGEIPNQNFDQYLQRPDEGGGVVQPTNLQAYAPTRVNLNANEEEDQTFR